MTLEEKTAQTLLQAPKRIRIGDTEYTVSPPTLATLVLVSSLISQLPHRILDKDYIAEECLAIAKDCGKLGCIAAAIILGADGYNKTRERDARPRQRLFGLIPLGKAKTCSPKCDGVMLGEKIMSTLSPSEMNKLLADLLSSLELTDFFALTTFLAGINMTRATKVEK